MYGYIGKCEEQTVFMIILKGERYIFDFKTEKQNDQLQQ